MMREYKKLRKQEEDRQKVIDDALKSKMTEEKLKQEKIRREIERDKILQWKRNKIDIQNLARLQLEDDLRLVLRQKQSEKIENQRRIKFRKIQFDRKVDDFEKIKRERMKNLHQRNVRLESLRQK